MQIKIIGDIAVVNNETPLIADAQSARDLIISVHYEYYAAKIAIYKAAISEDFFRLSTGVAGEVAQAFVNYGCRLAIIGDFSGYTSKPLYDYIYECNKGRHLNFVDDEQEAVKWLGGKLDE